MTASGGGEETGALWRIARGALGWTGDHLSRFRLPEDPAAPGHDRGTTLKPLTELARTSLTVAQVSHGEVSALAREFVDFAWRETGRGEVLAELARREPYATYPLETYAVFSQAGLRHAEFEAQLRDTVRTRAWRRGEREATRTLAVLDAERKTGLPPHRPLEEAQAATWLGALCEPWTFTTAAGYAATHCVFHLTDWCTRPEGLPPAVAEHLRLWLPAWLECTVEAGHWDLAGELLAVACLLPDGPDTAAAWTALARAQDPDTGAVPEHAGPDAEAPNTFRACYHSTLVTAFAAALTAAATATASPTTASLTEAAWRTRSA